MSGHWESGGKATGCLSSGVLAPSLSILQVVNFVKEQLPLWLAENELPKKSSEDCLNDALCDFLDGQAREHSALFHFKNQIPQKGRRKVDLGAKTIKPIFVEGYTYAKNEPFFVIEGKRLPTPGTGREREYVSGENDEVTGGIQRFKLGEHGGTLDEAGLVGYVQKHDFKHWFYTINLWIKDMFPADVGHEQGSEETLESFQKNGKTAYSTSRNRRPQTGCKSELIRLHHFWVDLREDK